MIKVALKLIAVLAFYCIIHSVSYSQTGPSCWQLGQNYYTCGVPTAEFEYMRASSVNYGAQVQTNWCWAACVQMVLNYHGLYVSQMDIVTRIYGSPYVNRPANEQQILYSLSGWAWDTRGRQSLIHSYGGGTTVDEIVNGLSSKWPLIVGLHNPNSPIGHAYVLTAIYYSYGYDYYGRLQIIPYKVVLRDPWPGNISRQEYSWEYFQKYCFMAIKIWVTRY
jgi:hypothetical protein